jgi:lauroyl/myristoyl acyltransferase
VTSDSAGVEARTVEAWFAAARLRQSQHTGPMPPRLIAENVRTMAEYMGMTAAAAETAAEAMAFWQMFLPSVMGSDPANFTDVSARLPHSFEIVRDGVARAASHRQLVFAAFHMTAFPLLAAMLVPSVRDVHGERGHALVARQNMVWLQTASGRWVAELADVISTDGRGLRQLQTGLRDGSIRRLLILVDGPHRPGPGTHPLTSISPALGFKTALLHKLIEMRIPVLPVTHAWSDRGLELEWHPLLPDDPDACMATTAGLIESLLRRHPEQWLNWAAARAASTSLR